MSQCNRTIAELRADFTEYTVTDDPCSLLNFRLWSVSHFGCSIIQVIREVKLFREIRNEAHFPHAFFTPQAVMHMHHGAGYARPLKQVRHDGRIQAAAYGQ
jgi:hypothetical protein